MKQINEKVIKFFNEQPIWYVSTFDNEPHVIPVLFKNFTTSGKIVIAQVFMKETVEYIQKNAKIAIAVGAMTPQGPEGYEIKGSAVYITEGQEVDDFIKLVAEKSGGKLTTKGVVIITPETVISRSPGPDNSKDL